MWRCWLSFQLPKYIPMLFHPQRWKGMRAHYCWNLGLLIYGDDRVSQRIYWGHLLCILQYLESHMTWNSCSLAGLIGTLQIPWPHCLSYASESMSSMLPRNNNPSPHCCGYHLCPITHVVVLGEGGPVVLQPNVMLSRRPLSTVWGIMHTLAALGPSNNL
jgi:hypothetical protein